MRWVLPALILPPLLLLLGGGIYSLSSLPTANAGLKHTDDVRIGIGRFRSTVLDAETSVRGYLVTDDAQFLEPYQRSLSSWRRELERVRALTTDNPDQQTRLRRLEQLTSQRFELLARLQTERGAGLTGAELTPTMLEGKRVMDALVGVVDEMESEEAHLDRVRQEAAVRQWEWTMALFVGGGVASLLIVGTVWMQRGTADARRRAAEETQQAVDRERGLLNVVVSGIDDGITLQDRNGKLVFANPSAAGMIGFASPEELLSAPVGEVLQRFDILAEDGSPFPVERLPARAVLEGRPSERAVLLRYRVRATGEERWANVRAHPVLDAAGQVVQAINVFRDVTAEHRQEQRRRFLMRASDELSSSLDYEKTLAAVAGLAVPALADWCTVDLVEDGCRKRVAMAHVDPAKIALVAELERRYPADPQATNGVPQIIRSGQPQLMSEIPRALLTAAAVDQEHMGLINQLELESFMGVPLRVGGRIIGAVSFVMAESRRRYTAEDLTFAHALADRAALAIENARLFREAERARAALAVELKNETQRRLAAENATRFAEMFVGILGHDLRNPMNAVLMTARLLRRRGEGDMKAIERIETSTQRMSNMVSQLLDLTRSRLAGGIKIERKPVDLGARVGEIIDELRRANPGREVLCEMACQMAGEAMSAMLDEDRFAQVLYNLVGNALEHGDPARPVTVTVTVAVRPGGDDLVITVHNDGPPIPPDLLPAVFDPFRRTTARHRSSQGLGLGLFISQQIVLAHGGSIQVRSTTQEGTTFTVTIPCLDHPHAAAAEGELRS